MVSPDIRCYVRKTDKKVINADGEENLIYLMEYADILEKLPYKEPFLFVDELLELTTESAHGLYTFKKDLEVYRGHFVGFPVTPGVLLTECCAQIGLACLGIYLMRDVPGQASMAMSSAQMEYYKPVFPGETVSVQSKKVYFRFGKLKCQVKMYDSSNQLVCKGTISGMLKTGTDEN